MDLVYGTKVDFSRADVFTMMNEHSYAAFMGVLSSVFMKAHVTCSVRETPYKAALIISESMTVPYKNQPESSYERIKAILSRMVEPNGGIDVSIYIGDTDMFTPTSKIGLKHTVSQCWSLASPTNPQFVTGNAPPRNLNKGENTVRYFPASAIQQFTDTLIDYSTPITQVFDSLDTSKAHVCYQGGTAWLSVAMNIPTYIVHPTHKFNEHHLKSRLYGQDLGNINILLDGKIHHTRTHPCEKHIHIKQLREI